MPLARLRKLASTAAPFRLAVRVGVLAQSDIAPVVGAVLDGRPVAANERQHLASSRSFKARLVA